MINKITIPSLSIKNYTAKGVPEFSNRPFALRFIYIAIVAIIFSLIYPVNQARAGFPLKKTISVTQNTAMPPLAVHEVKHHPGILSKFLPKITGWGDHNHHQTTTKNRGLASALGILGFVFGIFGLQRLYLGYTWQGFFQMLTPATAVIMLVLALYAFPTASAIFATTVAILAIGLITFVYIWQIVDIVRISSGTLMPKWGYYRDRVNRNRRSVQRGYSN